jgi:hypothetical protein
VRWVASRESDPVSGLVTSGDTTAGGVRSCGTRAR